MNPSKTPLADIGFSIFVIVLGATVLWEARTLPPGTFEPLGSAPIPQAICWMIIALSLLVMGNAWRSLRLPQPPRDGEVLVLRPMDAAVTFGLTVAYVLSMAFGLIAFVYATVLFLFITVAVLTRFAPKGLAIGAAIALVMGFGCEYAFTKVFYVDLPTS